MALLRRLPLSEAERISMNATLSLDLDPLGDEILTGLSFEDSIWLLNFRKSTYWRQTALLAPSDAIRAADLTGRHEQARINRVNAANHYQYDLSD